MLQGIFSILDQVLLADAAAILQRPVSYRVPVRAIEMDPAISTLPGYCNGSTAWLLQQLNSKKNLQLSYDMALDFNQTGQGSVQPYTILPMRPMPMRPCRQAPAAAPSSIYRLCAT